VGEAYAGNKLHRVRQKIEQIDEILGIIKTRWELREENRGVQVNIAQLVGLSALILFSGKDSASTKAGRMYEVIVNHLATSDKHGAYPHLRLMIQHSRFCIIVVHSDDCPQTSANQHLAGVMSGVLQTNKQLVKGMEALLKRPLGSIGEE
jgi:hypothetical protein